MIDETKTLTDAERGDLDHATLRETDQAPTLTTQAADNTRKADQGDASWVNTDEAPTLTTAAADNAREGVGFTNYLNPVTASTQLAKDAIATSERFKADDADCTERARAWVTSKRAAEFEAEVQKAKVFCLRDRRLKAEKAARLGLANQNEDFVAVKKAEALESVDGTTFRATHKADVKADAKAAKVHYKARK